MMQNGGGKILLYSRVSLILKRKFKNESKPHPPLPLDPESPGIYNFTVFVTLQSNLKLDKKNFNWINAMANMINETKKFTPSGAKNSKFTLKTLIITCTIQP